MSTYPAAVDSNNSLPLAIDNQTSVSASVFNNLRGAVISIESALGVQPAGVYGSVASRLTTLEGTVGSIIEISLAGDLGNTLATPHVIGIQGRPVSSAAPAFGQPLVWNGVAWVPSSAGGDVTGPYTATTVVKIQGNAFAAGNPTKGQFVVATTGTSYGPASISGDISESAVTPALLTVTGIQGNTFTSGSPVKGQFVMATSTTNYGPVTISGDVSESGATAGLLKVIQLQGHALPVPSGTNTVLEWSGSALAWNTASSIFTPGGDLAGTSTDQVVVSVSSDVSGTLNIGGASSTTTVNIGNGTFVGAINFGMGGVGPTITLGDGASAVVVPNLSHSTTNNMVIATPSGQFSHVPNITYSFSSNALTALPLDCSPTWIVSPSSAPLITQSDNTAASATAQNLTIQAQNATGATSNGGNLLLKSGTGTSSNGQVEIYNGSNQIVHFSPNSMIFAAAISPAVIAQDVTSGAGVNMIIQAQSTSTSGAVGGPLKLLGGNAPAFSGTGGDVILSTGTGPTSGAIELQLNTTTILGVQGVGLNIAPTPGLGVLLTGSTVTLTSSQYKYGCIVCYTTSSLGVTTLVFPNLAGVWLLDLVGVTYGLGGALSVESGASGPVQIGDQTTSNNPTLVWVRASGNNTISTSTIAI